jgi:hypothetical protein
VEHDICLLIVARPSGEDQLAGAIKSMPCRPGRAAGKSGADRSRDHGWRHGEAALGGRLELRRRSEKKGGAALAMEEERLGFFVCKLISAC